MAPSGGHTRERQEQMPAAESKQMTALKAEIQRLKAATNNRRDDAVGGKGRGGKNRSRSRARKGGGQKVGQNLPRELVGLDPNHKGKRLCFDFN